MSEEKTKVNEQENTEKDNVIYIGEKPFMNYITGVVTQFKSKNQNEVIIRARGKFISRAVDVAEFSVKRFLKEENIKISEVKIDSEEFESKEGKKVNVSTIDIVLIKK